MSAFPRESLVVGGPKTPNIPSTSVLPDAYSASFFRKPEDWTDKELSKRIKSNPVVDLCLRISTYDVGRNNHGCFDPKRFGQKMSSSSRLYQMIGRYVGYPTFKRMLASSSRQWKFVEECWIANMHTVLLNRDFDPTRLDRRLFRAIRRYKLWFLKFFFAGSVKTFRRKSGKIGRKFVPINFERGISALKNIAGCLQWATLCDLKSENASPPVIPYWKGWHSEKNAIELTWFDGHLGRWKTCLLDLKFSDSELTNLCQIRTFGRALPCPTRKMCEEAFSKQAEILTTDRPIDDGKLSIIRHFSKRLGERLGVSEMPTNSHISVSTSGCFELSQSDGGLASYISGLVSEINVETSDVMIEGHPYLKEGEVISLATFIESGYDIGHFSDVYGDRLFPRPTSFYRMSRGFSRKKSNRLLDLLFGESGDTTRRRLVKRFVKGEPLPHSLGRIVLWLSSFSALQQGYFSEGEVKVQPICTFRIGDRPYPVFSQAQMKFHLVYNPVDCPKVKLDCLAEPGAKTRPLGKNQAWFTMVTRTMRFMVEPIVARDGRARIGLRSTNKMWSFLKYVKGISTEFPGRVVCQSSDFKSATDLISLDLIKAIWEGFLETLPKKHPFWVYYKLIVCRRRLYSPKKFQKLLLFQDGAENQCGSFMGEPMSFITLTLLNLLVEEISAHYYLSGAPLWSPTLAPDLVGDPVCICGDDVGALRRDLRRARLFKRVALDMRMEFSWKDGVSKRVLIFCEDHTLIQSVVDHEGQRIGWKPVYVDVIKSRLLTTMARDHSENRSSILGKGRMLSNQLDYFEDKNLKIACLSYFSLIFDRVYGFSVINKVKLPLYLPPCCGGAGIPTVDSLVPGWMFPYIGYIFKVLDFEDYIEKYSELQCLSALNSRVKHGVSTADKNTLRSECSRYQLGGADHIKPNVIYDDNFVITYLQEVCLIDIPVDPYLKKYDFSSLENEAGRIGFVQFSSLAEEVERILNFQRFFSENVVKEPRTFNRWVKSSNKYWKGVFRKYSKDELAKLGKERFTTVAALEKSVTRAFSGWIFIGDSDEAFNLVNSGPSLKLCFSLTGALSHGRVHGTKPITV